MTERKIILDAKGLTKRYGGLVAVNDVSIHLYEGEILGLIGANGAGKTTFFNMISGVQPMTAGELYFDGKRIPKPAAHQMCKLGIGRTYQICQPFSNLTVLENTMVGAFMRDSSAKVAAKEAEEILELVGLSKLKDTVGRDLSLPQLKRMEVARALATKPTVLLLDEVMAGLNPTECQEFMELIRRIRDTGISIIIIEHVMRAIMSLSERIYVLNQGCKIAEGTPEEISNNPDVIKSYLGESRHARH